MPTSEAQKRANKKYYEKNKEKVKEYEKEYREANKDKEHERHKKYREANKDKEHERHKKYRETNKKNIIINSWLNISKIKFADRNEAEFYYETYINTHRCTWCDKMFENSKERCMDHCHTCGLPRAIICRSCNNKDLVPCVNCLL